MMMNIFDNKFNYIFFMCFEIQYQSADIYFAELVTLVLKKDLFEFYVTIF